VVQDQPWQIVHDVPISNITRAKWTGGVAQAIRELAFKHKALSSNPNSTKTKKAHSQQNLEYKTAN
jgi:hypothetical protein